MTSTKRLLLLGHRGARVPHLPENTIAAFDLALQAGCDGFEFDVRRTRDRQLVVVHDPRLGGLEVAGSTYAELQQRWQERIVPRLPLTQRRSLAHEQLALLCLPDVLQRYRGRAFLDIELKAPGMEDAVLQALADHAPERFLVSSFLPEVLLAVAERDQQVPLGLIAENARQLTKWSHLPLSFVIPQLKLATGELIEDAHGAGKQVMVWTANREEDVKRLANWGADAIVSDDPEMLARVATSPPGGREEFH
ncbi:MAG TPA: glycerophosphodiester phosphodiesterase [Terriglobales bacterium]|nr:glycerophosphodiester phosphodiesterase [Terriglobales bacterium]